MMTPIELYQNLLLGAAGNATYEGLKGYLTLWQNIVVPKAQSNNDLIDRIEMLIEANVQSIETQTIMLKFLNELHQKIVTDAAIKNPNVKVSQVHYGSGDNVAGNKIIQK